MKRKLLRDSNEDARYGYTGFKILKKGKIKMEPQKFKLKKKSLNQDDFECNVGHRTYHQNKIYEHSKINES